MYALKQEKCQVTVQGKDEAGMSWNVDGSSRDTHGIEDAGEGSRFNAMPTGMEINNTPRPDPSNFSLVSVAGAHDVSNGVSDGALNLSGGFTARSIPEQDEVSASQFYGDAGGFKLRNNYLDRS